jgi:hypothetical protein
MYMFNVGYIVCSFHNTQTFESVIIGIKKQKPQNASIGNLPT